MTKPKLPEELSLGMGYDPTKEVVKKEDAVFNIVFGGSVAQPINWKSYLTPRELQGKLPFCVSFSRTNCGEGKAKKENLNINLSDRNLAVGSKTNKVGNGLNEVSEYFRTQGIVDETTCPLTPELLGGGTADANWKKVFDISHIPPHAKKYYGGNHSWVFGWDAIVAALAFSPVQIAVGVGDNWEATGMVKDPGVYGSYHAVTMYTYRGDLGEGYYIQDSIGKEFKVLAKDYKVVAAKSFADLPDDWKNVQVPFELTTEKARFAWLSRPDDLQKVFKKENRFVSDDGAWTLYDWCRRYGPADMPEVFLDGKMDWGKIVATQEQYEAARGIEIKKKSSFGWLGKLLMYLFNSR